MVFPFSLDDGIGSRATIGLIVLQSDETLEYELDRFFGAEKNIALHHTRIPSGADVTEDTLARMLDDLSKTVSLFPVDKKFDIIGYGCTSGAAVIGSKAIAKGIRLVYSDVLVADPLTSVIAALESIAVSRIGFVSPYIEEIFFVIKSRLEEAGFDVSSLVSFGQAKESIVAKISEESIFNAICCAADNSNVEAVFVSCTNLRTFRVIERAEKAIGRPVITSNQAFAWNIAKMVQLHTLRKGPGRLFEK